VTAVSLRLAAAPTVTQDVRPHLERSAAAELRHQHPGIRGITHSWHTVTSEDPDGHPGLVGWHFLTATGLVDDDDS
jgi:hypothetical protein